MSILFTRATPTWTGIASRLPEHDFGTTVNFSISCWIKRVSAGTIQFIFGKTITTLLAVPTYYLYFDASDVLSFAAGAQTKTGGTLSDTASWHHIAMAADRATRTTFWIDGVLVDTSKLTTSCTNTGRDIFWGARNGTKSADNLDAKIEDFMLWRSRIITQNEVSAIYTDRLRAIKFIDNSVGYWPMDLPGDNIFNTIVSGDYGLRGGPNNYANNIEPIGANDPAWNADNPQLVWPGKPRIVSVRRKTRIQNVQEYSLIPPKPRRKELVF